MVEPQYCFLLNCHIDCMQKVYENHSSEGYYTRIRNDRGVICYPAHDITIIIFATLVKTCYEHFHGTKLLHYAYLSQIL